MIITTRHIILVLILGAISWVGVGCNTTKGIGEDIEAVGEEISESADETGGTNG